MTALKKDNAEKSGPEYLEKQKRAEKEIEEYVKGYRQILLDYDFFNRILLKKRRERCIQKHRWNIKSILWIYKHIKFFSLLWIQRRTH